MKKAVNRMTKIDSEFVFNYSLFTNDYSLFFIAILPSSRR